MSSQQQPEKWGYGLTWLITIGLAGMIVFGFLKLKANATEGWKAQSAAKKEADIRALAAAKVEVAEIKAVQDAEAAAKAAIAAAAQAAKDAANAGKIAKGKTLYNGCLACHGAKGEGNPLMKSPAIAGQQGWYIKKQLKNFKAGIRGGDMAKDPTGGQMSMMAKTLIPTDEALEAITLYVETLPKATVVHSLKGDAAKGKALYGTCVACHGAKAEGVVATKGPSLNGLPDWYIVEQLKKFKSGVRGSHPKDVDGAIMKGMAALLVDEQAMKDVSEYIKSLK